MKTLLFLLTVLSVNVSAEVDYNCQSNCTNNGGGYQYCTNKCEYSTIPTPTIQPIDYSCLNQCTSQGNMYNYCTQKCSY